MSDGVSLEVSSNTASTADIQANFDAEPKDGEVHVPEADRVKKAAQELGKKGGEAAAKARESAERAERRAEREAARDTADEPDKEKGEKPAEKPVTGQDGDGEGKEELGNPRHDAKARIQQLARERNEERQRARDLEARLAKLEADRAPKAEPAARTGKKPTPEQYETYEAYVEALTEHKMEARIKRMAEEDAGRRQAESAARAVVDRVEAFNKRLADKPDLIERADPRLLELRPTFTLPPDQVPGPGNALAEEIVSSPVAPQLIEYLSANEAEVRRILALPNAREITRAVTLLEATLSKDEAPAVPVQPEPLRLAVSQAKPPVRPLSGSAVTGDDDVDGEQDFDRFVARANARDRAQRRR
jgi:hypothetical protein